MALNKIQKFVKENSLSFVDDGSTLNSNCVILAGYACYIGEENPIAKLEADGFTSLSEKAVLELNRVFTYARGNNYAAYWKTPDAKLMYKF